MTKKILTTGVIAILVAMFHSGCEMNLGSYGDQNAKLAAQQEQAEKQTTPNPTTPQTTNPSSPPVTPPSSGGGDQLNISGAVLYRGSDAAAARVTRSLDSADKQGNFVNLSFSSLNWPTTGTTKKADGYVFIFWHEGSGVVGGMFDAHKVDQTAKTLDNIYGGILDGHVPPSGAQVYFCMTSLDGSERTNVARSPTNW